MKYIWLVWPGCTECCGAGWLSNSGLDWGDRGKQFKGERDHTGPGRSQAVPPPLGGFQLEIKYFVKTSKSKYFDNIIFSYFYKPGWEQTWKLLPPIYKQDFTNWEKIFFSAVLVPLLLARQTIILTFCTHHFKISILTMLIYHRYINCIVGRVQWFGIIREKDTSDTIRLDETTSGFL